VPDPRTGVTLPNAQSAAVEDATALLVNPAGIALVEGFELNLGGLLRTNGTSGQTDVDTTLVTTPMGGLGLGIGAGLSMPAGKTPRGRFSLGVGTAANRSFSLGAALHAIAALQGGSSADWLVDVGAQIRPARWLGVGLVVEGLGDQDLGPATARAGVSLRPFGELLTVGVDGRVVPGSRDLGSERWSSEMSFVPGVSARLDLGGVALTAGGSLKNLGAVVPGPPELELVAALELNGANLGATLQGGVDGLFTGTNHGIAGARVRASSSRYPALFGESGRWLALRLAGEGVMAKDEGDEGLLASLFAEEPQAITVLAALHNAAEDPSVEGVLLHLQGLNLGLGRMAELRAVLVKLREAGKKVVVHLEGGDDADVFLASAADRIYLTPAGSLELNGLRAEMTYLGDTLAKIGVEAEAVSAGRYKSAPRQFTSNEPSPEEIEVQNALLDGAWQSITSMIAAGRGLTVDEVKAIIDKGGLTSAEAVSSKIVDGVAYTDELQARVEELAGHPVNLEERFLKREDRVIRWDAPARIALIPVEGTIAMSGGFDLLGGGGASAESLVEAIQRAANDDGVRAIVLRIDSPGGDALASDLIWHAVMKAREKKPVIASMGDVAASGGYYVASAADTILAEPNTITGSIGVFGLLFNVERLADDWGVRTYPFERGALPGPSVFRPLNDAERAALQRGVDATYERFIASVIAGRGKASGLTEEKLREVAEGHVWTGDQAKEKKLVDAIGGVLDALELARERAGLKEDEEVALDVVTGAPDGLGKLVGLARVLAPSGSEGVVRAARLLLGDPAALTFVLDHEGQPMAVAPVTWHVE
jgi:protease-4